MKRICITCRKEKDLDDFEEYGANINKSCEGCMEQIRRAKGGFICDMLMPRAALLASRGADWLPHWGFKFDFEFEPHAATVRAMLPTGWVVKPLFGRTLVWDGARNLRLRISETEIDIVPAVQITVDTENHIKGITEGRADRVVGIVRVCGEIVHKTYAIPVPVILGADGKESAANRAERLQNFDFLQMICEKYKALKYPDYGDPLAYWPKVAAASQNIQLDLFTQQTSK